MLSWKKTFQLTSYEINESARHDPGKYNCVMVNNVCVCVFVRATSDLRSGCYVFDVTKPSCRHSTSGV
jgi:hypothetical protein